MSHDFSRRTSARPTGRQEVLPLLPVALMMSLALLLGGGGFYYPLLNGIIEISALGLLCWIGCRRSVLPFSIGPLTLVFACLLLLIPVGQLIPVPPWLWGRLPGRELPVQIFHLAGLASRWAPISLEPQATIRSALSLAPPFAMFLASLHLSGENRARLVWIFVAAAFLSLVLGALQRATGGTFAIFETEHTPYGPGLFVNRNHQAAFLLTAAVMLAAVTRRGVARGAKVSPKAAAVLVLVLFAGVVATTSRMGLVVMPLAAVAAILTLFPLKLRANVMVGSLAALAVVAAIAFATSAGQLVVERFFVALTDERLGFWRDTRDGIYQFWPVGTGLGTFRRVYPLFEDLSVVSPLLVNNAHNDYLELVLECGVAGVAMIALVLVWLSVAAVKLSRRRSSDPLAAGAVVCITMLLVHSLVDYPVRMLSISTLVGLFAALIVAELRRPQGGGEERSAASRERSQ